MIDSAFSPVHSYQFCKIASAIARKIDRISKKYGLEDKGIVLILSKITKHIRKYYSNWINANYNICSSDLINIL